jgi:hypothetical protein
MVKIKKITYLVPPKDLVNDCLDVFVLLEGEDGTNEYVVEVTTPACLSDIIETSNNDFLSPSFPYIIVSKLTDEIIQDAIEAFIDEDDDLYWLKLYHVAATLDIEDLDEILARKMQKELEIEEALKSELDEDSESDQNN